jgi:hypothetical protein
VSDASTDDGSRYDTMTTNDWNDEWDDNSDDMGRRRLEQLEWYVFFIILVSFFSNNYYLQIILTTTTKWDDKFDNNMGRQLG